MLGVIEVDASKSPDLGLQEENEMEMDFLQCILFLSGHIQLRDYRNY